MNRKIKLLIVAVCGALVALPLAVKTQSEAAGIPVIDSANISQQYQTYLQTYKTVLNTAQQITLQLKELETLPTNVLSSYKSVLQSDINTLKSTLKGTSGALNPTKDLQTVWNSTFRSAGDITATNYTNSTASAVNSTTISALDQNNFDSFNLVKTSISSLDNTQSNLDQLMTLNASAVGQKQSLQVNNMLLAEQAKLLQQQNAIRAADTMARVSYYERQNQKDSVAQAQAQQAADSVANMDTDVPVYK